MNPAFLLAAAAAAAQAPAPAAQEEAEAIVVTASLLPVPEKEAPASVTVFDTRQIEAFGSPYAADLIRLSPGVSVSASGAQGTQTQVRIRGAEANHTLVFIDGIAFNDLAAGNEPRFETFTADSFGRIELIRGPQSALWGSEALGGVVAMSSPYPLGTMRARGSIEYGSRDTARASAAFASGGERAGVSATASWLRSDGIDILGAGAGDRDGFENVSVGLKGVVRSDGGLEAGAVARYIHHDVEFDGQNAFFQRADTAEASSAETFAVRGWVGLGLSEPAAPWTLKLEAQYLDSVNRNRDADVRTNDSIGRRLRFGAQAGRRFELGGGRHELIAAIEREDEDFGTRDLLFGGASDRDLERGRTAFVGEWRASWGSRLILDAAVRHDDFDTFLDATTVRANAQLRLVPSLSLLAGYGEGIAQPSFVDLFGFGSGSGFVPNPDLRPERSRGYEAGLRWSGRTAAVEAVAFTNALRDEIVEDFSNYPFYTVVNAPGKSRRRGIEVSAEWTPVAALHVGGNYSYIDTRERDEAGAGTLREVRRPSHTANVFADWRGGPFTLGAALSYVGARIDRDFDLFPAPRVRLDPYVLASARVAYRLTEKIEAFARVEDGFDAEYQDVIGYATPGRGVYAGLRLRLGD
jgi:vitamin B12 transporter